MVDCQRGFDAETGDVINSGETTTGDIQENHDGGKKLTCVSPKWFPASEIDHTKDD